MANEIGHPIGPMGWVVPDAKTEVEMLDQEKRFFAAAADAVPEMYSHREMKPIAPEILDRWNVYQESKGRFAGSNDFSLLDEFVFGKTLTFLPQDIGSCVWSNTFRRWIERMIVEIAFYGDAEEWTGLNEFGPNSIAPFCVSYGFARELANMRGGDGLYCSPMQKSLVQDGVVLCNTPKLQELLASAGATSERDYPEVRSTSLYRQIGDWAWNKTLRPYAGCKLLESPKVTSYEQFLQNEDEFKPMFMCSSLAIKIAGQHPDGFTYHVRNTQDSWAHNMGLGGRRVTSKGDVFHRVDNTSWLSPSQPNRDAYVYWHEAKEIKSWISQGLIDVGTVGEIDGVQSIFQI